MWLVCIRINGEWEQALGGVAYYRESDAWAEARRLLAFTGRRFRPRRFA
jgi:hypothetical protein